MSYHDLDDYAVTAIRYTTGRAQHAWPPAAKVRSRTRGRSIGSLLKPSRKFDELFVRSFCILCGPITMHVPCRLNKLFRDYEVAILFIRIFIKPLFNFFSVSRSGFSTAVVRIYCAWKVRGLWITYPVTFPRFCETTEKLPFWQKGCVVQGLITGRGCLQNTYTPFCNNNRRVNMAATRPKRLTKAGIQNVTSRPGHQVVLYVKNASSPPQLIEAQLNVAIIMEGHAYFGGLLLWYSDVTTQRRL